MHREYSGINHYFVLCSLIWTLTFCTFFAFIFFRRTGWANLNTSVPNLEEVSSTEFPDDAVQRIGKVNEMLKNTYKMSEGAISTT